MLNFSIISKLCVVLLLSAPALAKNSSQALTTGNYKVISCNDGDTCRLLSQESETVKVRLAGIDAPEFAGKKKEGQPMSDESKVFLNRLVLGKKVQINAITTDIYSRTIAEIFVDGKNVNIQMLEEGLAEVYQGKAPKGIDMDAYYKAEENAKSAKKGIWALSHYESPSVFRKRKRHK